LKEDTGSDFPRITFLDFDIAPIELLMAGSTSPVGDGAAANVDVVH